MMKREDSSPGKIQKSAQNDIADRAHGVISVYSPSLPDTPLGHRLRKCRYAILDCAARHGTSNIRVFGSAARGEDRPDSDVDFVVDVGKGTGLFALEALRRELSEILGVPVDVALSDSLRPHVRAEIERDAIPL
jgi:predicted nucleotidyltransferase